MAMPVVRTLSGTLWFLAIQLLVTCGQTSDSDTPALQGGAANAGKSGVAGGRSGSPGGGAGGAGRAGGTGGSSAGAAPSPDGGNENTAGLPGGDGGARTGGSAGATAASGGAKQLGGAGAGEMGAASGVAGGGATAGGAGGESGAPAVYAGPLPVCPWMGTVGSPGQCDAESELRLTTVTLELAEISGSGAGGAIVPGDDVSIVIDVSTSSDAAPADRVGLLALDEASLVSIEDGPCFALSDFGIVADIPSSASFQVHFDPSIAHGTRIRFVTWATPYHSGCTSPLLQFEVTLQ
jgi:hypothetical protein